MVSGGVDCYLAISREGQGQQIYNTTRGCLHRDYILLASAARKMGWGSVRKGDLPIGSHLVTTKGTRRLFQPFPQSPEENAPIPLRRGQFPTP
ncbi:hypothetical protein TNIN_135501 [Trichonephila inaurata madagascariensis]|uniref:Uncharacterized protein n=1 Tax=Trichonephila inaurata madagascariensis TaxID=2747483 RepID=A0A8X6WZF2_9ARAC|nr:hypothetical protein TNIN_135501 [Trichonephila inaurata madagascariensis]